MSKTQAYRLLRDLPGNKAGTIFKYNEPDYGYIGEYNRLIVITQSAIEDTNWFAPLPTESECDHYWIRNVNHRNPVCSKCGASRPEPQPQAEEIELPILTIREKDEFPIWDWIVDVTQAVNRLSKRGE